MIDRLIAALIQEKCDVDARELAEALWLLSQTGLPMPWPTSRMSEPRLSDSDLVSEQPLEGPRQVSHTQKKEGEIISEYHGEAKLMVPSNTTSSNSPLRGTFLRISTAPPLPNMLAMAQALRPLRRRVPSRTQLQLHEQATALRSAEERILMPEFGPLRERWLAIDLVVDISPSMLVWRSTILELRRLLIRMGAFRDVKLWSLNTSGHNGLTLSAGLQLQARSPRSLRELCDPTGRRLLLIASDCSSDGWRSGAVSLQIQQWSRTTPVTIVQVLPERLWSSSALGHEIEAKLQARSPAPLQRQINVQLVDEWLLDVPPPHGLRVPVITADSEPLRLWARYMTGASDVWIPGYILEPGHRSVKLRTVRSGDPRQRWTDFAASASPAAQKLVRLLASAPLTLPIMRIVQDEYFSERERSPTHIAEAILGGLFVQHTPWEQIEDPDEMVFEFHDGVRKLLLERSSSREVSQVFRKVSAYIADRAGQQRSMRALTGVLGGSVDISRLAPFASVQVAVLRRLGYHNLAEAITKTLDLQPQSVIESREADESGESKEANLPESPSIDMPSSPEESTASEQKRPSADVRIANKVNTTKCVFISYKRNARPDTMLAKQIYTQLKDAGCVVFMDQENKIGQDWAKRIEREIEASDYVVVLLSELSVQSEVMIKEVEHAYQHYQRTGRAKLLPVRTNYMGILPYPLNMYLDQIQYAEWRPRTRGNTMRLMLQLLDAIGFDDELPEFSGADVSSELSTPNSSNAGRSPSAGWHSTRGTPLPPPPYADPRFIATLTDPSGALSPSDQLYIERDADRKLLRELSKERSVTITIRAPRQMGKSSLLIRGMKQAESQGNKPIFIDLQPLDNSYLQDTETFFRYLATEIVNGLGIDSNLVNQIWGGTKAASNKITDILQREILPHMDGKIIIAIDEVDRLLGKPIRDSVFGLLRSWHNNRAVNAIWNKVDTIMVISTEPYLLISDINQSPFNVGSRILLDDFDRSQVFMLNERYHHPLSVDRLDELVDLFGGHPYLTSKALYTMVADGVSWERLVKSATSDRGPFGDHLKRYWWLLRDDPALIDSLKQVLRHGAYPDDRAFYRLSRAGLLKGDEPRSCEFRCKLYEQYFRNKL